MKHSILKETVVIFCAAVLIASTVAVIFSFVYNAGLTEKIAGQFARAGAASAARAIEGVDYDALTQSKSRDVYMQTRRTLKSICKSFELKYLYVYEPDTESDSIRYIMTVASDEKQDKMVASERGLGKVISHNLTEQEQYALSGEEHGEAYVEENAYGDVYTWICPIYKDGSVIALVGSDYSTAVLFQRTVKRTLVIIVPMICVLILAILISLFAIRKKILLPVKALSQRMNSFITDKGVGFQPLDIHLDNEIGEMADSFSKMSGDIKNYLANIKTLTAERTRTSAEFDIARRIQNGIVPENTEVLGKFYNAFARAKAAKDVGGDFYDCFEIKDGNLCAVIGDVSGKGIAAAMFMVMTRTMLHDCLSSGYSPADALNNVNNALCTSNPEGMFATVFAAVLNPKNGELCFANAGHTRPVITGENARFLEIDSGIAVGLFEDSDIKDNYINLKKGESIILYSDGVTDIVNKNNEFFGAERLFEVVRSSGDAKIAVKSLEIAASEFAAGAEQFDDYTVLALNYIGDKNILRLVPRESSLPELRKAVLAVTGKNRRGKKIYLACEEAFVNIASYSKATAVETEFEKQDHILRITFSDNGTPFNPVSANIKKKGFDELDSGGMGLSLIRQIAENMWYKRQDNKNILFLEFTLKEE